MVCAYQAPVGVATQHDAGFPQEALGNEWRMRERKPINSADYSSYSCGSVGSALTSEHKAQHILDQAWRCKAMIPAPGGVEQQDQELKFIVYKASSEPA